MDEMIRYIFGSPNGSETTLKAICKTLRKQRSFNCNTALWMVIVTVHLAIRELEIRNVRSKMENLEKDIKELRKMEGD